MWLADNWKDYEVLDTSAGEKLERWGKYILVRPDPQVIWNTPKDDPLWRKYDARYARSSTGGGKWQNLRLPAQWQVRYKELTFQVKPMNFKHTGVFPEQAANWNFIYDNCRALAGDGPTDGERVAAVGSGVARGGAPKVLNLFAYTGGATLAARAAGAEVTHVDSVRQVVTWSRENMELSGLEGVRWIVEDALKFVRREVRRGSLYRGIILDPPAYGRGADGERWILEDNIGEMLECCAQLLEPRGAFLVLNLYSMGLSSTLARTAVRQAFGAPREEQWGELCFTDRAGKQLPLGTYYRFTR